jgi:hypothetical protein
MTVDYNEGHLTVPIDINNRLKPLINIAFT